MVTLKGSSTEQLSPQGHGLGLVDPTARREKDHLWMKTTYFYSLRHDDSLAQALVKEVRLREHNFGASDLQMRHF